MTLIITAINHDQAILVADRRLSRDGLIVDDDSNKAITLVCQDARVAIAFTGLARAGSFETRRWLLEVLGTCAAPEFRIEPLVARLAVRATTDVAAVAVSRPADRRLTIVLAGYSHASGPPRPYLWQVSNFEDGAGNELTEPTPDFKAIWWRATNPPPAPASLLHVAGTHSAAPLAQTASLNEMLRSAKPASAIVAKAVSVLRAAAVSDKSRNAIGKECSSIIVPRDLRASVAAEYHGLRVSRRVPGVAFVEARGGPFGCYLIDEPEVGRLDATGNPISLIPVVPRNRRCPCGSGKRFKNCHGEGGTPELLDMEFGLGPTE